MEKKKIIVEIVTRGLLIKNNKVLTVNKIGEPHKFIPGGRVEIGEGIKNALFREIKEELNKVCIVKKYFGCIEDSYIKKETQVYQICHFFLIDIPDLDFDSKPVSAESELEFYWHEIKDLDKINICPPYVIELIRNAATQSTYDGFWRSVLE